MTIHDSSLQTTLVVIDPASEHGEDGIQALDAHDRRVTLVIPLHGRRSRSLRDFAESEDLDVATVGSIYLEQLSARIDQSDRRVTSISTDGSDFAADILSIVEQLSISRVIVPTSLMATEGPGIRHLALAAKTPILITGQPDETPTPRGLWRRVA